ncbi:MAG: ORF6N domain-containing protein [Deltaproteobacteria bacterium]|nr:ORF6N domain-containing protein [Deltaproteobacteria bacterium]
MSELDLPVHSIESKIYLIRGERVILDCDLAEMYQVTTARLNEQVSRNLRRFPGDFMFRLSNQEFRNLISQFAISRSGWGGRRTPPLAFTEQGVSMLSAVLHSERAIDVNVAIMRTFVKLRQLLSSNRELEKKIVELEQKYDGKFKLVFEAIRELMSAHAIPRKRIIGLGSED